MTPFQEYLTHFPNRRRGSWVRITYSATYGASRSLARRFWKQDRAVARRVAVDRRLAANDEARREGRERLKAKYTKRPVDP